MSVDFGAVLGADTPGTTSPSPMPVRGGLSPLEQIKADLAKKYEPLINEMVEQAASLEVVDDQTNITAVEMTAQARKLYKAIEDIRKAAVAPSNEFVKAVNAVAKTYTGRFETIGNGLKKKISQYQAKVELERRKAEAEARKAAEEAQKKLDAEAKKAGVEPVKVEAPVVPDPPKATYTAEGSAHQRKQWTFEVENAADVPREYLTVDEKKIREAVKAGVREIPGVRIWEESTTVIRA